MCRGCVYVWEGRAILLGAGKILYRGVFEGWTLLYCGEVLYVGRCELIVLEEIGRVLEV